MENRDGKESGFYQSHSKRRAAQRGNNKTKNVNLKLT